MNLSSIFPEVHKRKTGAGATILVALLAPAILASCNKQEPPAYVSTKDRVYLGSLYYAKSDCISCHGAEWDGNGPDAKSSRESGWNPSNFTGEVAAETTPLDYFMAMTDPKTYFKKKYPQKDAFDVEMFAMGHTYLTYTDKGRWAIANFLYGLQKEPADMGKRKDALKKMSGEVSDVYSAHRRWEVGFKPVEERIKERPEMDSLVKKVSYQYDANPVQASVSDSRKELAEGNSAGAQLFRDNCVTCHGIYGEGRAAGPRFGLTGMIPMIVGFPRTPNLERQKSINISTRDLKGSSALGSMDTFKKAHQSLGLLAPEYNSLSDDEWTALYNFSRDLAAR